MHSNNVMVTTMGGNYQYHNHVGVLRHSPLVRLQDLEVTRVSALARTWWMPPFPAVIGCSCYYCMLQFDYKDLIFLLSLLLNLLRQCLQVATFCCF